MTSTIANQGLLTMIKSIAKKGYPVKFNIEESEVGSDFMRIVIGSSIEDKRTIGLPADGVRSNSPGERVILQHLQGIDAELEEGNNDGKTEK